MRAARPLDGRRRTLPMPVQSTLRGTPCDAAQEARPAHRDAIGSVSSRGIPTTMTPSFEAVDAHPVADLADVLNRAFAGYVGGELRLDGPGYATLLERQGVDPALSRVARVDGALAAIGLMSRDRGPRRLATMGVVPEARGRGVGRALLEHLLDEACQRGDACVELEVIGTNEPAVALYRGLGFATVTRLVSLEAGPAGDGDGGDAPLEPVPAAAVADAIASHGANDLPWQLGASAALAWGPAVRGYRLGPAWALLAPPRSGSATLLSLLVEKADRERGHGRALLRALRNLHPSDGTRVPALLPEALAGFFESQGFARGPLWQWQMARHPCPTAASAR